MRIDRYLLLVIVLALFGYSSAHAQKTNAALQVEINANVPPGAMSGQVTPAGLNNVLQDMVLSGLGGATITGTPSAGYVPIATSATAAAWGTTFTAPSYTFLSPALSGSAALGNLYQFTVPSDTQQCVFCTQVYSTWNYGGATARGTRSNGVFWNIQTAANSGSGTTAGVGVEGVGQSNAGDGGTGLTNALVKGTYFGGNLIGRNGGTNVQEVVGLEADTETTSTSSQRYNFGVTSVNYSAVQGSSFDAAFAAYSGGAIAASGGSGPWGPGLGYHCLLCAGELSANGLVPLDSTATIIGGHVESLSVIPVAYGFDANLFSFSSFFLRCCNGSSLFTVDGSGNVVSVALTASGLITGSLGAQVTGAGVQVGSPTGGNKGAGTINIQGTIWTNGTQGIASQTCTVNQAKTLIFTNGILTGGTCNT